LRDSIRILNLQFNVCHGVRPEEETLPQPFEVDVEITLDLSEAAASDRLKDTLDYSRIVAAVREVMNGERCRLLEHLAGRIVERVCELVRCGEVVVRVRKPRAPLVVPFKTVEIELRRDVRGTREIDSK